MTETGILEKVITVSEAAKMLNKSDRHIRRMCLGGKLEARLTDEGTWLIKKPTQS